MKDKKAIGVAKDITLPQIIIILIFVLLSALLVAAWVGYSGGVEYSRMYRTAEEVTAQIFDVTSSEDSSGNTVYRGQLIYVSDEGKEYTGYTRDYSRHSDEAQSRIGEKVQALIFDDSDTCIEGTMKDLSAKARANRTDLILSVCITCAYPVSVYLFAYRFLYRRIADYKILRRLNPVGDFIVKATTEGEVVYAGGFVVKYLKVRYADDRGIERVRWARNWFTPSEAKYLKDKKFIKIIPYKNAFGVYEEITYK